MTGFRPALKADRDGKTIARRGDCARLSFKADSGTGNPRGEPAPGQAALARFDHRTRARLRQHSPGKAAAPGPKIRDLPAGGVGRYCCPGLPPCADSDLTAPAPPRGDRGRLRAATPMRGARRCWLSTSCSRRIGYAGIQRVISSCCTLHRRCEDFATGTRIERSGGYGTDSGLRLSCQDSGAEILFGALELVPARRYRAIRRRRSCVCLADMVTAIADEPASSPCPRLKRRSVGGEAAMCRIPRQEPSQSLRSGPASFPALAPGSPVQRRTCRLSGAIARRPPFPGRRAVEGARDHTIHGSGRLRTVARSELGPPACRASGHRGALGEAADVATTSFCRAERSRPPVTVWRNRARANAWSEAIPIASYSDPVMIRTASGREMVRSSSAQA